eukprot:TRINITY_DN951_c0_g2_i2.p1 TRINITY_DN951_c0_g2~~TRINITY_DN951_c0_g2_i2.p1  ORF type:complete len:326 (+),score=64.88 TRINITY_DN951_c0_g2_i2:61-978(+)
MPKDSPKDAAKKGAKKDVKAKADKSVAPVKKAIEKKPKEKKGGKDVKKGAVGRVQLTRRDKYGPLFDARPRKCHIGQDLKKRNHTDLTRFVRFPRYIRIQRQRKILSKRLKVPPPINQFNHTLPKARTLELFKLLKQYRPETREKKKKRLLRWAKLRAQGKRKPSYKKTQQYIKFGINNVTSLVEKKRARLVVIANDVDPIEVVVWLPALCRKMEIPYVIVKSKSTLGTLVHRKTASCIALTQFKHHHKESFKSIVTLAKEKFNDNTDIRKKWGGGRIGVQSLAKRAKREKQIAAEQLVLKSTKK